MTDFMQLDRLLNLVGGILGFVLLVMMIAISHRLRGGLLYRALVPWTIALFMIGVESMLSVFITLPSIVDDGLRLTRIILYLIGGVILWNRLREAG